MLQREKNERKKLALPWLLCSAAKLCLPCGGCIYVYGMTAKAGGGHTTKARKDRHTRCVHVHRCLVYATKGGMFACLLGYMRQRHQAPQHKHMPQVTSTPLASNHIVAGYLSAQYMHKSPTLSPLKPHQTPSYNHGP